jgi:nitrite reductase (NADH) small subunit
MTTKISDDARDLKLDGYGSENAAIDHAFRIVDEARPPKARSRGRLVVCAASEIELGQKRVVDDPETGISVGVFNFQGKFYALKNVCPHQGAALCLGKIQTTHRPGDLFELNPDFAGRIIRCPWHGWEFDIITGKGLYDKNSRVATYVCEIDENGDVVVLL